MESEILEELRAMRKELRWARKEIEAMHSQWATCEGVLQMPPLGDGPRSPETLIANWIRFDKEK